MTYYDKIQSFYRAVYILVGILLDRTHEDTYDTPLTKEIPRFLRGDSNSLACSGDLQMASTICDSDNWICANLTQSRVCHDMIALEKINHITKKS